MSFECTLGTIANLDANDPDAVQALLQACTGMLLDPLLWIWVIAITLVCAAVGALIGQTKGRWLSGMLWGAALGPLGWLVVLLSRSGFPECPDCGYRNAPSVKACRQCGVNLRAAAQRSERARIKRTDRGGGW
jgi:ribosomal protein L40E